MAAKKTAVNYENGQMALRGPERLNVCLMPGILPAAAHVETDDVPPMGWPGHHPAAGPPR